MPAKDTFHHAVRNALMKAGWTITYNPFTLEFEDVNFYVDLGAEKVLDNILTTVLLFQKLNLIEPYT